MESRPRTVNFDDITTNSVDKYMSLSFEHKLEKYSYKFTPTLKKFEIRSGNEDKKASILSKKTIRKEKQKQAIQNKQIKNKWEIVNEAFDLIRKGKHIGLAELKEFIKEINNWLKKLNYDDYKIIYPKDEITIHTKIDEIAMLDIFLYEIKNLFIKLKAKQQMSLSDYLAINPFVDLLRNKLNDAGVLQRKFTSLVMFSKTKKKELLKILKIDYFQKCINDLEFHPNSLIKILNIHATDLKIIDLSKVFLPLNDNGKLLSYSNFLEMIFESTTYLQAMVILMNAQAKAREVLINAQSKPKKYSKKRIKDSMDRIYKYLLNPIEFPNEEETRLYGVTCINLHVYISSFVINNIQHLIDDGHKRGRSDHEKINRLKHLAFNDVNAGVNLCVFILTILHESSHVLRRHLVEPNVYIETEEIEKELLREEIEEDILNESSISTDGTINEGGDILDYILFGGTLLNLVAEEVRYIFDVKNWEQDIKDFRNSFRKIRIRKKKPLKTSKTLMLGGPIIRDKLFCGNRKSVI